MKGFNLIKLTLVLFIFLYSIPSTLNPTHAACVTGTYGLDLGDCFGYSGIKSLGEGTSKLINPFFSVATALVVIYFIVGAFKYLKSAGNKEEMQGARQIITHSIFIQIIPF